MLWEFLGILNGVMQHSSVNTLFSNEEGGCGGYLGGYLCVSSPQPMTHFRPDGRQSCFQPHSH